MSDLSEQTKHSVIDDVIGAYEAIKNIYSTIGQAYSAYKTGKTVLIALGILDSPENPFDMIHKQLVAIQEKLDTILNALERARLEQAGATDHITRTTIKNDESSIKSSAYNAYSYLKHPSPDNRSQFYETRDQAQESINHFKDNPYYWKRIHLEQCDYNDEWSGTLTPPTEQNGLWVWDFIVTLPAYLSGLANWCVVILSSDDGFKKAHLIDGTEIIEHIEKLHSILYQILASFEPIPCPDYSHIGYVVLTANDENFFCYKVDGMSHEFYSDSGAINNHLFPATRIQCNQALLHDQLNHIPCGAWRKTGYPVGVVEKCSGWASIAAYPREELIKAGDWLTLFGHPLIWSANIRYSLAPSIGIINPSEFQKFYDYFILRHTIRTWREARKLSAILGLPIVHKCITDFCAMRNIPTSNYPLPPKWRRYVLISIRELWSIVPESLKVLIDPTEIGSMRKLAELVGVKELITLRKIFSLDS